MTRAIPGTFSAAAEGEWEGRESRPVAADLDTTALTWSYNPWRERPAASVVALLIAFGCVALLQWLSHTWLFSLALGIAATLSFAPLLFAVECRVDSDGISHRAFWGREQRPWSQIRRVVPVEGGILVSPFGTPHRLDSFRALVLPIPRSRRDDVLSRLEPRLTQHGL